MIKKDWKVRIGETVHSNMNDEKDEIKLLSRYKHENQDIAVCVTPENEIVVAILQHKSNSEGRYYVYKNEVQLTPEQPYGGCNFNMFKIYNLFEETEIVDDIEHLKNNLNHNFETLIHNFSFRLKINVPTDIIIGGFKVDIQRIQRTLNDILDKLKGEK